MVTAAVATVATGTVATGTVTTGTVTRAGTVRGGMRGTRVGKARARAAVTAETRRRCCSIETRQAA